MASEQQPQELLKQLNEAIERRIEVETEVASYLSPLKVVCKTVNTLRDLAYANYLMLQLLLGRQAAEDAEFRTVFDGYRKQIERLALDTQLDEIRIEQIQMIGEAEDTPEASTPKRKRKK